MHGKRSVIVVKQGKLLTVSFRELLSPSMPTSKRGVVKEFSRSSRLNLLKFIAKIEWSQIPQAVFITLTYPDEYANRSMEERTLDKKRFIRDIEKHLGRKVSGIWRIEWKPRKTGKNKGNIVPHYHFLLIREKFVHHKVIRKIWRSILHVRGPLATDIRAAKNGELASVYIAKYMSKVHERCSLDNDAYLNTHGRHWGLVRKKSIPMAKLEWTLDLSEEEIEYLLKTGHDRLPWVDMNAPHSFSLIGKNAVDVSEYLRKLTLDRTHPIREDT